MIQDPNGYLLLQSFNVPCCVLASVVQLTGPKFCHTCTVGLVSECFAIGLADSNPKDRQWSSGKGKCAYISEIIKMTYHK